MLPVSFLLGLVVVLLWTIQLPRSQALFIKPKALAATPPAFEELASFRILLLR